MLTYVTKCFKLYQRQNSKNKVLDSFSLEVLEV